MSSLQVRMSWKISGWSLALKEAALSMAPESVEGCVSCFPMNVGNFLYTFGIGSC